jgi:hypothetical protein
MKGIAMKFSNRTVTGRNFLGAFLGGMLGILACGYFGALALVIGVVAGVVFGFCYDWLWEAINLGFSHAKVKAVRIRRSAQVRLGRLDSNWRKPLTTIERLKIGMAAIDGLVIGASLGFFVWLAAQIDDWVHRFRWASEYATGATTLSTVIGLALFLVVACVCIAIIGTRREEAGQGRYESAQNAWLRSPSGFIAVQAVKSLYLAMVVPIVLCGFLVYWVLALPLFVSGVLVPVLGAYLALKLCAQVVRGGGYMLCLVVTLAVTATSAYIFRGWFSSQPALWMLSLSTGAASALAVHLVHQGASRLAARRGKALLPKLSFMQAFEGAIVPCFDRVMQLARDLAESLEYVPMMGRPKPI